MTITKKAPEGRNFEGLNDHAHHTSVRIPAALAGVSPSAAVGRGRFARSTGAGK